MVDPVRPSWRPRRDRTSSITLGGNPVYLDKTEAFAQRINLLFPIAILVIGLLHFEAFRTKQGLILPLVTALMAVHGEPVSWASSASPWISSIRPRRS